MKRTYTRTVFKENLQDVEFELHVHEAVKYEAPENDDVSVTCKNVVAWSIVEGGKEAEEIEEHTDSSGVDENHEYLILHFADGTDGTFRNSHVDMFINY